MGTNMGIANDWRICLELFGGHLRSLTITIKKMMTSCADFYRTTPINVGLSQISSVVDIMLPQVPNVLKGP